MCVLFAVLPPVFPFPLYLTVYWFTVHCAYTVLLLVGVYVAPAFPIFVPPDDDVYHPLKVYPVLVGVGRVTLALVHFAYNVVFAEYVVFVNPDAKYPLDVILCVPLPPVLV